MRRQRRASFATPIPREAAGFVHPNPAPRATICRDITSFSMVMETDRKLLWVSDNEIPACQGTFYAFDFAARTRLPALDIPGTGFSDALQAARSFISGDTDSARASLKKAFEHDGETAPLLLMRALVEGVSLNEEYATERALRRWCRFMAARHRRPLRNHG